MRTRLWFFVIFWLAVGYGVWNLGGQVYRLYKKNEEIKLLQGQKEMWQEKNDLLAHKVKALDSNNPDKDLLEELAREKLGYDHPNERRLKQ